MVSQGVTTIIVGQDGGSALPLTDFYGALESDRVAVNVALYAGHNSIRSAVMGDDFRREATAEEVEEMRLLLSRELEAGALGLSTGLEYDPGVYSSTDLGRSGDPTWPRPSPLRRTRPGRSPVVPSSE